MRDQTEDIQRLSRELVHDFLLINGYGFTLPKRIILYGCPKEVMDFMINVMEEELASRKDITVSTRGRFGVSSMGDEGYYIDVGYFIGNVSRAHQPLIDEGSLRWETLSDVRETRLAGTHAELTAYKPLHGGKPAACASPNWI
jgi:hypothetical protein